MKQEKVNVVEASLHGLTYVVYIDWACYVVHTSEIYIGIVPAQLSYKPKQERSAI